MKVSDRKKIDALEKREQECIDAAMESGSVGTREWMDAAASVRRQINLIRYPTGEVPR